jgi:Family of unknown function (DUF5652)
MQFSNEWWSPHLPVLAGLFAPALILLVLWSVFWKGLALWHSARRSQPWWFVIILVVNTAGILEIIYLFAVAKLKLSELFSYKEHNR